MLGVGNVNQKETNLLLVSMLSDEKQKQVFEYLTETYFNDISVYQPKTAEEIFVELAKSRTCYERGEYKDFDEALNEISGKYGL